ncbi:hypothetical protein SIAM614_17954 [Roseibium aggregatum IAM 12614]|uniref:Uncharacterized protein n=1 Tax=Roseibium aggregatum (strain ATCC 25650 / DSM 13394 / JCM 20685 / NBRC 16684 / NCIMB 2208 / IAM 12614 / B1) TaxID=384765 RepID=A0NP71_ROSAI|nr:hypothetical protein SIAM614_17954 [Roseibium aggregatum IAM 12614]
MSFCLLFFPASHDRKPKNKNKSVLY